MSEPLRPQACPQCGGLYGQHTMNCGQAWSTVKEVEGVSKLKPEDVVAVIADGIDQAVKAACAQKDSEIERLKAEVEESDQCYQKLSDYIAQQFHDAPQGESAPFQVDWAVRRIAQLEALLSRVPHYDAAWRIQNPQDLPCHSDCPACKWESMKQTQ